MIFFNRTSGKGAPEYAEIRYGFGGYNNLFDYAINDCRIPEDTQELSEIRTHYQRSRLFLLGLMNHRSLELQERWLNSEDFHEDRLQYLDFQTGLHFCDADVSKEDSKWKGFFRLPYDLIGQRLFSQQIRPVLAADERIPTHHPCPEGFHIVISKSIVGVHKETGESHEIAPGAYRCRTRKRVFGGENSYCISVIEFDVQSLDAPLGLLVSSDDIWPLCREGHGLIIAITLYDLPTHFLMGETLEWCQDWEDIDEVALVDGFRNPKKAATALVKECVSLWDLPEPAFKNGVASWFFEPEHGVFPDQDLHERYYMKFIMGEE